MRIISGSARGIQLASFDGNEIRPTSDRVRGAIFSIITSRMGSFHNLRVLDIFAGTGAMGVEALSRNAGHVTFIDQGQQAKKIITSNLKRCHMEKNNRIINQSAQKTLPRLEGHRFDLIFIDPPYRKELLARIIQLIDKHNLLTRAGIICAEEDKKAIIPAHIGSLEQLDRRNYGNTSIYLFGNSAAELLSDED